MEIVNISLRHSPNQDTSSVTLTPYEICRGMTQYISLGTWILCIQESSVDGNSAGGIFIPFCVAIPPLEAEIDAKVLEIRSYIACAVMTIL